MLASELIRAAIEYDRIPPDGAGRAGSPQEQSAGLSIANEERKQVWFDYPRWTKDGAAIVYMAGGKLFLHTLADGSTKQVSTDPKADYRYPHGEATPN